MKVLHQYSSHIPNMKNKMKYIYESMTEEEIKDDVMLMITECFGQPLIPNESTSLHFKMCRILNSLYVCVENHLKLRIKNREKEKRKAREKIMKEEKDDFEKLRRLKKKKRNVFNSDVSEEEGDEEEDEDEEDIGLVDANEEDIGLVDANEDEDEEDIGLVDANDDEDEEDIGLVGANDDEEADDEEEDEEKEESRYKGPIQQAGFGRRVAIFYPEDKKWYKGSLVSISGHTTEKDVKKARRTGNFRVKYDDETECDINLHNVRFKYIHPEEEEEQTIGGCVISSTSSSSISSTSSSSISSTSPFSSSYMVGIVQGATVINRGGSSNRKRGRSSK